MGCCVVKLLCHVTRVRSYTGLSCKSKSFFRSRVSPNGSPFCVDFLFLNDLIPVITIKVQPNQRYHLRHSIHERNLCSFLSKCSTKYTIRPHLILVYIDAYTYYGSNIINEILELRPCSSFKKNDSWNLHENEIFTTRESFISITPLRVYQNVASIINSKFYLVSRLSQRRNDKSRNMMILGNYTLICHTEPTLTILINFGNIKNSTTGEVYFFILILSFGHRYNKNTNLTLLNSWIIHGQRDDLISEQ